MGDDEMICKAARVSTGKDVEKQEKVNGLINYLAREQHTSPFEHTGLTIRFEAPIFVHRQVMTHRTLSKNTQSGRYSDLAVEYYVPDGYRPLVNAGSGAHPNLVQAEGGAELHEDLVWVMTGAYEDAHGAYDRMVNHVEPIAKELARIVEPQAQYTAWMMTGNVYAWFQFLEKRDGSDGHPQHEIQDLANQVWPILEEHFPIATQAWKQRNKGKTRKLIQQFLDDCAYPVVIEWPKSLKMFAEWAEDNNK